MRYLKPFCIILIGVTLLTSCTKDEEALASPKTIVGTWKLTKFVRVCDSGPNWEHVWNACGQKSRRVFNQDGTHSTRSFYAPSYNVCHELGFDSGTWKFEGDGLGLEHEIGNRAYYTFYELKGDILRLGNYVPHTTECECTVGTKPLARYSEYVRVYNDF